MGEADPTEMLLRTDWPLGMGIPRPEMEGIPPSLGPQDLPMG